MTGLKGVTVQDKLKTNNKLIKELAEQANLEIDPAYPEHNQKVLEKFAELIVRECAQFTDSGIRKFLLKHFGIEE